MDMFPFRHNGMFVRRPLNMDTFSYNIIKVNNVALDYTNYFYWKKDFIESSLGTYVSLRNSNNFNLLQKEKIYKYISNSTIRNYFVNNLCMKPGEEKKYPEWIYSFCLKKIYNSNNKIQIITIRSIYEKGEFIKIDSTIIY
jgi:hypothetical protein